MVEDSRYEQFPWGKASFQKLIATWKQEFFVQKQLYSIGGMPHVLNVWMYECCSEVDSTTAERVGNVIPRIFNWKVVGIKFVYTNLRSTHEEVQRLDLPTIDGVELNNDESALSHDTYPDRSDKRHAVDIHTQSDMDHQGFEDFSTIPPPEILMKAGLSTHASTSQPTKKRRTVRFDTTTVPMQDSEKTPPSVSEKSMPIYQSRTSDSEHLDAPMLTPSSSDKSGHQDSFDQKWNELKFFLQSYVDQKFTFLHKAMVKQDEESNDKGNKQHAKLMCMPKHIKHAYEKDQQVQDMKCLQKEDVPSKEQDDELGGFTPGGVPSIDNFEEMNIVTSSKDKGKKDDELGGFTTGGVPSVDNSKDMDIVTSSKDKGKKDFEGFSSDVGTFTLNAHVEEMVNQEMKDIKTATLNALVDAVVNQNSDYSNVQNPENIHKDHSIDAIMQGLIAPVDDIPLEVAKSVDETINLHSLFDSQIPSNYPDSVVAAHLAVKIPAKRTRTRSRIFKSPYTTDFASGSKVLEDESTEFKQTFAFEGYGIYDDMPSSIIEQYEK
ncbi:hypothetical protein T459_10321 [Capsicum annuum]|uniref:DUF1985 domain-containing protein n=1 Tax=Capsicum annuum TaxID=4072 RepID=A0A2G3A1V4_CAPAN|nr:hypothetical protein T459_10321 [Capsicum annuum]